jgi:hypothetical protein
VILSVRGTSGSGKTTVAKRVLHSEGVYAPAEPFHTKGRKQPLYYTREPLSIGQRGIALLGHYESATGGCDTISGVDKWFELARELHGLYDVFFEGLILSCEQNRTADLHREGFDVRLFYFNLTLQECLDGVVARRSAKGNTSPLNPKTTADRHRTLRLHPPRFRRMGVHVTEGCRETAVVWLREQGVIL